MDSSITLSITSLVFSLAALVVSLLSFRQAWRIHAEQGALVEIGQVVPLNIQAAGEVFVSFQLINKGRLDTYVNRVRLDFGELGVERRVYPLQAEVEDGLVRGNQTKLVRFPMYVRERLQQREEPRNTDDDLFAPSILATITVELGNGRTIAKRVGLPPPNGGAVKDA